MMATASGVPCCRDDWISRARMSSIAGRFHNPGEPPFADFYRAYDHYLGIVSGTEVEEGLEYFRQQVRNGNADEIAQAWRCGRKRSSTASL